MPSPTPSESMPSATPAKSPTPTPSASSVVNDSTPSGPSNPAPAPAGVAMPVNNSVGAIPAPTTVGRNPGPVVSSKTLFIIIIKSAKTGTLHAVMNPKSGPGVLATFEDVEQAVNVTTNMRECKTNEFFILPVGE